MHHFTKLFMLLMLTVCINDLFAQDLMRREMEVSDADDFNIVPIGGKGALVFYTTEEKAGAGKKMLVVKRYDTTLTEVGIEKTAIDKSMQFATFDRDGDDLYIMFSDKKGKVYETTRSMTVLQYSTSRGKLKVATKESPLGFSAEHFVVNKGEIFSGGRSRPKMIMGMPSKVCLSFCCIPLMFTPFPNYRPDPVLLNYGIDTKPPRLEMLEKEGSAGVIDITKDTATGLTYVVIDEKLKKTSMLHINTYKGDKKVNSQKLKTGSDSRFLVTGKVTPISTDHLMVMGTYAKGAVKIAGADKQYGETKFSTANNGFYITSILNGKQEYIKYYDFKDFASLQIPEKKVQRAGKKGKDLKVSMFLFFHEPLQFDNEIVVTGEIYYPVYSYYTDANGNTQRVFEGFRYQSALVMGLDENGEKLWDINFPIQDILTFDLRERVTVNKKDGKVYLIYSHGGSLKSMVIEKGRIVADKTESKIETGSASDKVKKDWESDLSFWYDNYFLAYGTQKIKDKSSKQKRKVFYLNKIELSR